MPATERDRLKGRELEALFGVDTDPEQRRQALKRAVKLAMAGDGRAAFQLGVLYRHGPEHPSGAVERNVETARYWLAKCIEAEDCPRLAMASMAELELEAGNYKPAMQWAQAWAALEKEIDKATRQLRRDEGSDAYAAYLLSRCFQHLDRAEADRLSSAWLAEFVQVHGTQMNRMLAYVIGGAEGRAERWAEFTGRKSRNVTIFVHPEVPVLGLYLLRAAPEGGRAEAVTLIEGLPKPSQLRGLAGVAGRSEYKPYSPDVAGERRYHFMPIAYADRRHGLKPAKAGDEP